jgi:hypothetical protein
MKHLTVRGAAIMVAAFVTVGLVAPSAQAATWKKTANTAQKAYSSNGYRAKVGPSAAPKVSGYTAYSKTVSIKSSSGKYVAKGVTSKMLGKGTYKVYSTFKYRKSVPYKTSVNQTDYLSTLYELQNASCTITSIPDIAHATCSGRYNGYPATVADAMGLPVDGYAVGDVVSAGDPMFEALAEWGGTVNYKTTVTKYKYAYTGSKYAYRYVTVKKVYNPPTVSYTEFKKIKAPFDSVSDNNGSTLAQVRAIIGSNGKRTGFTDYGDSVFYAYEWKQANGDPVSVGFWNGRAYFKTWY